MSRLTIKDEQGWGVKGMPWSSLYPGSTITLDIWDKLYDAIKKLMEYEDTGLDPEDVKRLDDFPQTAIVLGKLNKEQRKHRWIPVEEQLPEDEDYILLSFSNFSVPLVGRYEADEDGGGAYYVGDDETSCVRHGLFVNAWMPLPESYQPARLADADNQTT